MLALKTRRNPPLSTPIIGLLAACLTALLISACATGPGAGTFSSPVPGQTARPGTNPSQWVGLWHGTGTTTLLIMPGADDTYHITLRNSIGHGLHYQAEAISGHLLFQQGGKALSIQPRNGETSGNPKLDELDDCLIITPGNRIYCRDTDTADGLPLIPGAYVDVRDRCRIARPSGTLYFNGRALARPGQHSCRARIINQDGIIFHLQDTCAPSSNGRISNESVSVPDQRHMALTTAGGKTTLYRLCAMSTIPATLRRNVWQR